MTLRASVRHAEASSTRLGASVDQTDARNSTLRWEYGIEILVLLESRCQSVVRHHCAPRLRHE